MVRGFSTYLDAVRFCAALTVVIAHFTFAQFTGGTVPYQGALAGTAVTVFFVLSGYVIAYVSAEKETTLTDFAISRAARVYSVAIPALILTVAVDLGLRLLGSHNPLPMYEYRGAWKYLPVFLTFTSEIGLLHVPVFSNGVFWSLSYEVWYYVTFAIAFYLRGWQRGILLPIALLILGLPALVYFPIWLAGVGIYYLQRRTKLSHATALALAIMSGAGIVAVRATGFDDALDGATNAALHNWPAAHLHNSMHFSTHYLIGILAAAHLYAIRFCDLSWLELPRVRAPIVYAAGSTFAMYLAHRPLMDFWAFVTSHDPHSALSAITLFALVLASVWIFSFVSERRKREWRALFRWLLRSMPTQSHISVLHNPTS